MHPIKPLVFGVLLGTASQAQGDTLALHLGRAVGNTIVDNHHYADGYQNALFNDKELKGIQVEASYLLTFHSIGRFGSAWILGLGHVAAELEESYPGGQLQLERETTFAQFGFRLQDENLVPHLILGAELMTAKGLAGKVRLRAPVGSETRTETYDLLVLEPLHLALTAAYKVAPSWSLNTMVRLYPKAGPNFFLGVAYDIPHL
ncbi:hypothetical protein [Oligoflexus tunisiensis]|uniref:hypothetical protein n=1 Tax=Oligoflexus tunisiensis TaxID=708132 RepID=UPI00114C9D8C|nr:hypothetical protein [Oligoflexus tunisiensis]